MRQPQRPLAQPVVIAIDVPSRKLPFEMHRQPVRQRALAEIFLEQEGLARVEFAERSYNLVQLGLHPASDNIPSLRGANGSRECAPDDRLRDEAIQNRCIHPMHCFATLAMTILLLVAFPHEESDG